jgi:lambda family phage portal protein
MSRKTKRQKNSAASGQQTLFVPGPSVADAKPKTHVKTERVLVFRNKYDAAQTGGENYKHWANADDLGPNAAANPYDRSVLRRRARYECANNCYARGIVNSLADYTVGTGPRLQMLTDDERLNEEIENAFSSWQTAVKYSQKLWLARTCKAECGEVFLPLFDNPKHDHPVWLDFQVIEPDLVRSEMLGQSRENEVDGITFDVFGNPVRYRVVVRPINDSYSQIFDKAYFVTAENMIHYFSASRPGQVRGIPEITPALPLFAQLRRFTLAMLSAAELQASLTGSYTPEILDDDEEQLTLAPLEKFEFERNMINVTPPGGEIKWPTTSQPSATYEMFKNKMIEEIARCLCIPFNVAAGNSSGYNYASGRLDHESFFLSIGVERFRESMEINDRILKNWLPVASLIYNFPFPRGMDVLPPHTWHWPALPSVDVSKEATAQDKKLKNFSTTYQSEYAKQGKDWRQEMKQVAMEKEYMRTLKITESDLNNRDNQETVKMSGGNANAEN